MSRSYEERLDSLRRTCEAFRKIDEDYTRAKIEWMGASGRVYRILKSKGPFDPEEMRLASAMEQGAYQRLETLAMVRQDILINKIKETDGPHVL